MKASNPHISIIAQTTMADISEYLHRTDIMNGFTNRFMWVAVRRSKLLPEGGCPDPEKITALATKLKHAVRFGRGIQEVPFSMKARDLWRNLYPTLTADVEGLLGAATSRAEPIVRRVATIYAVMDQCQEVRTQHLKAGLAVWNFCFDSAGFIFGSRKLVTRESKVEAKVWAILAGTVGGKSRSEISEALNHHYPTAEISAVLKKMQQQGKAKFSTERTAGRSIERWFGIQ